jgi:predicted GNAT family acetyltransferase
MNLKTHPDANGFLAVVEAPLLCEEVKNSLILGISQQVSQGRTYGQDPPYFLSVHDRDSLIAAAIRTPPYNLILYCEEDRLEALDLIAAHLTDAGENLPGAHGTVKVVSAFSEAWARRTGVETHVEMAQRVYCLTEVTAPLDVPGAMRWAEEDDVGTLVKWFTAFCEEAVPSDPPPPDPEKNVRRFISTGSLGVWETNGIVSMAGSSRGSKNGATVSAVYTPPEHRGNGYASACVAALSRVLLDRGNAFCTLYADLANPTSNKIYQRVGFLPVADCAMYTFTAAGSGTD